MGMSPVRRAFVMLLVAAAAVAVLLMFAQDQETLKVRSAVSADDRRHPAYVSALVGAALSRGNRYDVLTNGDQIFPAMLSAINGAKRRISFETYIYDKGNVANQFSTWQQTIGNNLSTMGRTLGLQQSQQQNQAAIIQALQRHSQSAQGQMQAIQAGNELAGANAAQLAQIHATLIATAQMQASNTAVAADRRATEDAALLHFAPPQPVATTGYQRW